MNIKKIIVGLLLITSSCIYAANTDTNNLNKQAAENVVASTVTDTFSVTNMGCNNDKNLIERALYRVNGVKKVTMLESKIVVKYDAQKLSAKQIIAAIEGTGTCENPEDRVYKVKKQG